MGSPNFYTGSDAIANFGIQFDDDEENFASEDFFEHEKKLIDEEIERLNYSLAAHAVVTQYGYHSGVQFYLTCTHEIDAIWKEDAKEWTAESEKGIYDSAGNYKDLSILLSEAHIGHLEQETFAYSHLQEMFNTEEMTAIEALEKIASEYGLGKIVGHTWTSSVDYNWQAETVTA